MIRKCVMGTIVTVLSMTGTLRAQDAPSPNTVVMAKSSLENAHTGQGEIIKRLAQLSATRQKAGGTSELVSGLQAVYRKQMSLTSNLQVLRLEVLQQKNKTEDSPERWDELMRHQRDVEQGYHEWRAILDKVTTGEDVPKGLKQLSARASSSSANRQMQEVVSHLETRHVSEGLGSAKEAVEELARLLQMLKGSMTDAKSLSEAHHNEIQEILKAETRILNQLETGGIKRSAWRGLRHDQSDVRERTKLLTFPEAGLMPTAHEKIIIAYDHMEAAEAHFLRQRDAESLTEVQAVVVALKEALVILESAAEELATDEEIAPPSYKRKQQKQGIMQAMLGAGSEGLDVSPGAMIAADIALLVKLRRRQTTLYEETIGKRPAKPLAARRQIDYASDIPKLVERVDRYLPEAAALLREAQTAMMSSHEQLKARQTEQSIPHQKLAIDKLAEAESVMRAWWKELLEAIDAISVSGGQAPSHGAGKEEKAKEDLLMILMREIVRVGRLLKTLETQIALIEGWSKASSDTLDPAKIAASVEAHYEMRNLGLDIFGKLAPLGAEAASLPEAVMEASQFIEGAGDALKENRYNTALERDRAALEFLTTAWTYLAQSMGGSEDSKQSDEQAQEDKDGQAKDNDGEGGVGGDQQGGGDKSQWDWELSDQARELIEQSQAGALPAKYEPAIKRYYERLNQRRTKP